MAKQFTSAAAFKASFEAHLRNRAQIQAVPFATLQLKFVIERLLARLFAAAEPPWFLKGGFAMDLRFRPRARTTKDVDLSVSLVTGPDMATELRERLQEAATSDLGDFLTYRIGEPRQELTNAPGGGARYPCEAVLLGKTYAKFHIDVGVGDALVGAPERLVGDDFLGFAGIGPPAVLAIPKPQQFAEKVHAYSYPWQGRPNTRTKDLVDLVLLIERGPPDPGEVRDAVAVTFHTRGTHPVPSVLPPPPDSWAKGFPAMANEAGLSTGDSQAAFRILEMYWIDHLLGEQAD